MRSKQGHHVQRCPWCRRDFARLDRHLAGRGPCGRAARSRADPTDLEAPARPRRRARAVAAGQDVTLQLEDGSRRPWTVDPDDPALADDAAPAAVLVDEDSVDWWRPEDAKPKRPSPPA